MQWITITHHMTHAHTTDRARGTNAFTCQQDTRKGNRHWQAGIERHQAAAAEHKTQEGLRTCHTASSHCKKTGDDSVGESECALSPNMCPKEHHSFSTRTSKPSKVR